FAFLVHGRIQRDVAQPGAVPVFAAADGGVHLAKVLLDVGANPPHGVGREARPLLGVELLHRPEQTEIAFLHEIVQARATAEVALGHRHHEGKVARDQLLPRAGIARLAAEGQLPLLLTREGSAAGQGLQVGIQPLELAAATLVHLRFPPPDENRYVTLSIPRMREGSVGCAYGTRIRETSADRAGALMDRPSDR